MNLNKALSKKYETSSLKEIMDAPVSALSGISDDDVARLKEALNVSTVGQLGKNKAIRAAVAIVQMAEMED